MSHSWGALQTPVRNGATYFPAQKSWLGELIAGVNGALTDLQFRVGQSPRYREVGAIWPSVVEKVPRWPMDTLRLTLRQKRHIRLSASFCWLYTQSGRCSRIEGLYIGETMKNSRKSIPLAGSLTILAIGIALSHWTRPI